MPFIYPLSLLWLALLVPVILFLYLLKLKRKELVVSSVFLWSQLLKDVQANAPFQKLKKNLLLFLQLLIVGLLVSGFARPFIRVRALGGRNVAVVLDGSASMKSRDISPSRFEAARKIALQMVDDLGRRDQMMVILATSRVQVLSSFSANKTDLRAAIGRAEASDTTTSLKEAVVLATSMTANRPDSQIYLLSDGAVRGLQDVQSGQAQLHFVRIGKRCDNLGITALDVRKSFTSEYDYQIFVAVRNFAAGPKKCTLELYRDDNLVDAREITIPPGGVHPEVFSNFGPASGLLTAKIDAKDDLDVDNAAYVYLHPRREISILLVTEGNLFLEKVLGTDSRVRLSKVSPGGYRGQSGYDIVIFDGHSPRKVGPGNLIFINTSAPEAPAEVAGEVQHPTILDVSRTHPLTRFADFSSVRLARALVAKSAPWSQTVAEIGEGPLVVAGEKRGRRSIFIGFDLLQSDLPLRVAFPIFFTNCVRWLTSRPRDRENVQVQTGHPFVFEVPPGVQQVTIADPAGKKSAISVRENPAAFSNTEHAGVYTISGKDYRLIFVANLLNSSESNTKPADRLLFAGKKIAATLAGNPVHKEIWRWLLLAAVAILAFEWYVYHRRV